jgi:hypothetical protein
VFHRIHELEGDEAAAGAAGRKSFASKHDNVMLLAMALMKDAIHAGNLCGIARTMKLRVLLRETQEPNPKWKEEERERATGAIVWLMATTG